MNVAVLGAGLMGRGIAALMADHGVDVVATTSRRHGLGDIERMIRNLCSTEPMANVTVCRSTIEAARRADVVIECLPEDLDLKIRELRIAQEAAGTALIASNTSSLRVSDIGRGLPEASRLVGLHFLNPPTLLPVVEVIATPATSTQAVHEASRFVRRIGLEPVQVKDADGFVINRLQFALLREAAALVAAGVASPRDVDRIVRDGLGRRWAGAGPFETVALGGVGLFDELARRLYPYLDSSAAATGSFAAFTDDVDLSGVAERRDAVLRALARL